MRHPHSRSTWRHLSKACRQDGLQWIKDTGRPVDTKPALLAVNVRLISAMNALADHLGVPAYWELPEHMRPYLWRTLHACADWRPSGVAPGPRTSRASHRVGQAVVPLLARFSPVSGQHPIVAGPRVNDEPRRSSRTRGQCHHPRLQAHRWMHLARMPDPHGPGCPRMVRQRRAIADPMREGPVDSKHHAVTASSSTTSSATALHHYQGLNWRPVGSAVRR